ncbi:hypothetical protein H9P43_005757 [Blastocladiella emersonii ATCC 22665]|nr:hypothetical protein H9P43_005757 [Blastocladiella emersonii ATCC 22665]
MNSATTALATQPVGTLLCQRDSLARSLVTRIVSVEPPAVASALLLVVLEDTVLFPEGGGQPADYGKLEAQGATFDVVDVQRKGTTAVHTVAVPDDAAAELLQAGATVQVTVDWARRLDNMQQHCGQHLLSAVAQREFGWRTMSWSCGPEWTYIEVAPDVPGVPAQPINAKTLAELEARVAEHIAAAHAVTVSETAPTDPSQIINSTIPADLVGAAELIVRYVTIGDVDVSLCCGTHPPTTLHIQSVTVRPTTERARGTHTRIFFAFGDRVRKHLAVAHARDVALTAILSSGAPEFEDKVGKLVEASRADKRKIKAATDSLAAALVRLHLADADVAVRRFHSEEPASMDLLLAMANALKSKEPKMATPAVLSAVDDSGAGAVLIVGPVGSALASAIARAAEAFPSIRGGGGKGKQGAVSIWQGRVTAKDEAAKLAAFDG